MSFVDRAEIDVVAGSGGAGASSFARFKYRPKGGPDGGDGGDGGSIHVKTDANLETLLDYRYHTAWRAERGEHGRGKNQTGASGADLVLPVPRGTVVEDAGTGEWLGELLTDDDRLCVARGGRGGRGNTQFATATHQAPREWESGRPGEQRRLRLTLKLIADVGLVGPPNAGKSTLLSVISAARPRIADYPFTTLMPQLGVAALSNGRTLVVADIPGIIEGAHAGKGLGLQFLQHLERTRILAYLVPLDAPDPAEEYVALRREVMQYSEELAKRAHLVVLTKRDLLPADAGLPVIEAPEAMAVMAISSVAKQGIDALKEQFWHAAHRERTSEGVL